MDAVALLEAGRCFLHGSLGHSLNSLLFSLPSSLTIFLPLFTLSLNFLLLIPSFFFTHHLSSFIFSPSLLLSLSLPTLVDWKGVDCPWRVWEVSESNFQASEVSVECQDMHKNAKETPASPKC